MQKESVAGINFTYDPDADVFVAPRPFPSWSLDENHDWQPPIESIEIQSTSH